MPAHINQAAHFNRQASVIVEGKEVGGKVVIVQKTPSFLRDIAPYFAPVASLLFSLWVLLSTGNLILPIWIVYFTCGVGEFFSNIDSENLSQKYERMFMNDKRFWLPLYAIVGVETLLWIWSLVLFSDLEIDHFLFRYKPASTGQYLVFCLIMGYYTGLNAISGHELLHKDERFNWMLGCFAYTKFFYSHFLNEHVDGHHRNVGTPKDPASAKKNEFMFSFILRSFFGSHICTWNREIRRMKREYGDDVSPVILFFSNVMVTYFVIHASMVAAIYYFLGFSALQHQFVYAAFGIFFLELVNYIEHYGLERRKDENGIYESVNKMHSWNSLSSPFHIRLQRHSDHHSKRYRPYQILRRIDDAPYLPFEYLHCFLIVLNPPLWFYLVNPRVDAVNNYRDGKEKAVRFDNCSEMTPKDKWLAVVGYAYLILWQGVFTYFSFVNPIYMAKN